MLGEIHNFSLGVEKKKKVNESLCSQCGGPWILRLKEGSNSNYDEQRMPKQRQTDTEKGGKEGNKREERRRKEEGCRCKCRAAYELCSGTRVYTAIPHLSPRGQHRTKH